MDTSVRDNVHIVRQGYACKMIVNGVDIGENYCINDEELLNALTRSGEFYPFTCDCGEPECAGILAPVCCQKNATLMTWHKKYPAPEETFTFESEKVLIELEQVLTEIFDGLFERFSDVPWHEMDFPHGPAGSTLISLRQTRDLCRKHLHIEETLDYEIRNVILSSMLEKNCTPEELIPELKIGNIHETPGMANEEPIHVAAYYNSHLENINLLLMRGADINVKDGYEETPLYYAAKGKYPEVMIPYLLRCGADIEARNDYRQTPFLMVLDQLDDPIPVLTMLKKYGCNVQAVDEFGNGALEYAAMRKHSAEVVKLLTEWGCQRKK